MATVKQPSVNPTNKLSAATVAAAVVSTTGLILRNVFPEWYDPEVMTAILPIAVWAAGFLTPDEPNVVVNVGT